MQFLGRNAASNVLGPSRFICLFTSPNRRWISINSAIQRGVYAEKPARGRTSTVKEQRTGGKERFQKNQPEESLRDLSLLKSLGDFAPSADAKWRGKSQRPARGRGNAARDATFGRREGDRNGMESRFERRIDRPRRPAREEGNDRDSRFERRVERTRHPAREDVNGRGATFGRKGDRPRSSSRGFVSSRPDQAEAERRPSANANLETDTSLNAWKRRPDSRRDMDKQGHQQLSSKFERTNHRDRTGPHPERNGRSEGPQKLTFTTATSEFLYGRSAVVAALKAGRRTFHNLYLHPRVFRGEEEENRNHIDMRKICNAAGGVNVIRVGDEYLSAMDKAAFGKPHNGCILEASPIPQPTVSALGPVTIDQSQSSFQVQVPNSRSPTAEVKYNSEGWRQPIILLLDNVV
jgi:hypothetical protein